MTRDWAIAAGIIKPAHDAPHDAKGGEGKPTLLLDEGCWSTARTNKEAGRAVARRSIAAGRGDEAILQPRARQIGT